MTMVNVVEEALLAHQISFKIDDLCKSEPDARGGRTMIRWYCTCGALIDCGEGALEKHQTNVLLSAMSRIWDEGFAAGWGAQHVAEKAFNPYDRVDQDA